MGEGRRGLVWDTPGDRASYTLACDCREVVVWSAAACRAFWVCQHASSMHHSRQPTACMAPGMQGQDRGELRRTLVEGVEESNDSPGHIQL